MTSLRFVCLTWTIVKLWSFLTKQIGEFDWTQFYVQGFIHMKSSIDVSDWWTSHHAIWSKRWIFPPNIGSSHPQNWGREGWETKLGGKKWKFYTHNFVSFPPTHHMLEGKCHVKQLSLVCVFHFDWNIEQHVHETCLFWTHTFFFEETLFHRCPLDYKQISASWHEAYSHTWISSKERFTYEHMAWPQMNSGKPSDCWI